MGQQWPLWSGAKRPHVQVYGQKSSAPPVDSKGNDPKAEKPGFLSKLLGSSKEPAKVDTVMDGPFKKPAPLPSKAHSQRDSELAQLSEMGFTIEVVARLYQVAIC